METTKKPSQKHDSKMKKIRVAVLMGGKSAEHEVSLASGMEVVKNLDPQKYGVLPVVIDKSGQKWQIGQSVKPRLNQRPATIKKKAKSSSKLVLLQKSLPKSIDDQQVDVVFIAMHGPFGEDGTIQGMLELAGLSYTGSGVLASALGMNKIASRKIWLNDGVPVVPFAVIRKGENSAVSLSKFSYPFVVKPSNQGSSVGVSIVRKREELKKALELAFSYSYEVLLEKYIKDKEVTCGVIGNEKPLALPLVEIVPKHEFFDYACKYTAGLCQEIVPARVSKKTTKKIQEIAVKAYKSIGCQGFGRVDMFLDADGKIYVSEINTIPGLTANSLLPKEARAAGISFPQLLEKIINYALKKNLA